MEFFVLVTVLAVVLGLLQFQKRGKHRKRRESLRRDGDDGTYIWIGFDGQEHRSDKHPDKPGGAWHDEKSNSDSGGGFWHADGGDSGGDGGGGGD